MDALPLSLPWVAFICVAVVLAILLCPLLQRLDRPRKESRAGSVADPRVARMDLKQRAYGKRLRREGRTLTAGKQYAPETIGPFIQTPRQEPKVVTLRRKA